MKKIIDLHTHLDSLNSILRLRGRLQNHIMRIDKHIKDDYQVILSVSLYVNIYRDYEYLKVLIHKLLKEIKGMGSSVELIKSSSDLNKNYKVGIILHVESARVIRRYQDQLPELFDLGIRGIIPVHYKDNHLGTSCDDPFRRLLIRRKDSGLTDKGVDFVNLCNNLNIWLDLPHTTDKTGYDILSIAKNVMVSHVGIRDLVPRQRNKDIDFLKAVSDKGGVIGLTPWCHLTGSHTDDFLSQYDFARGNGLSNSIALGTDLGAPIKTNKKIKSIFDIERLIPDHSFLYQNAFNFFSGALPC